MSDKQLITGEAYGLYSGIKAQILVAIAVVSLALGVVVVACTFIPANEMVEVNPSFSLPDNMINYTTRNAGTLVPSKRDAEFTMILSAVSGGEIVAGHELLINITMTAPPTLAQHVIFVYVNLDSALIYPRQIDPSTHGPLFAYVNLYSSPDPYRWSGTQNIYYSQAGAFGATVIFIRNDTYTAQRNTGTYAQSIGPIIQIASPDTITAKHNEGRTLGLTCFIITFAVLDLRAKTNGHDSVDRYKASSREDTPKNVTDTAVKSEKTPKSRSYRRRKSRNRSKNQ
jgi:hypothetical protein